MLGSRGDSSPERFAVARFYNSSVTSDDNCDFSVIGGPINVRVYLLNRVDCNTINHPSKCVEL